MPILSLALVFIFILYLIDKHNLWRKTFKIVLWTAGIGVIGIACVYGWYKYDAYKEARIQAAEDAARTNAIQDCEARFAAAAKTNDRNDPYAEFGGVPTDDFIPAGPCLENPNAVPPCWSKPDANGNQVDLGRTESAGKCYPKIEAKPKAPKPKITHLIAKYDEELTTEALNNLVCAHVSENEIVTLLEDYAGEVKVRKMNGRIGWASENVFKVQ